MTAMGKNHGRFFRDPKMAAHYALSRKLSLGSAERVVPFGHYYFRRRAIPD